LLASQLTFTQATQLRRPLQAEKTATKLRPDPTPA